MRPLRRFRTLSLGFGYFVCRISRYVVGGRIDARRSIHRRFLHRRVGRSGLIRVIGLVVGDRRAGAGVARRVLGEHGARGEQRCRGHNGGKFKITHDDLLSSCSKRDRESDLA